MGDNRFDILARSVAAVGTRRGLLRLLAGTPLVAALAARRDDTPIALADGGDHGSSHRRRRRKTRHKHDRNTVRRNKKHKPNKRNKRNKPPPPTCAVPGDCDDGFACTLDTCDGTGTCVHAADDSACTSANPCLAGRCDPSDPARDANGCVFDPITGGNQLTCGVGACHRTVDQCLNGVEQTCVPGSPSAEVCDGIDNDCDGVVDDDFPGLGLPCDSDGDGVNDGVRVCSADGLTTVCSGP